MQGSQSFVKAHNKKCIQDINDFCVLTHTAVVIMALDMKSRTEVVPTLFITLSLPDIHTVLSNARKNAMISFFTDVIPGLDQSEIVIRTVVTPKPQTRRLSGADTSKNRMSAVYMVAMNLKRFPVCRFGEIACPLMMQTAQCGCGSEMVNCERLLDDTCDAELNCAKYLFDAGTCDLLDCYGEPSERESVRRFLGTLV